MDARLYKWKLLVRRYLFVSSYFLLKRNLPTFNNGKFETTVSAKRLNTIATFLPPRISYLEIGIENARTFVNVHANEKVGVDPFPLISTSELPNSVQIMTIKSDAFFQREDLEFDLAFIDGLHTWDQTYRDIVNAFNSGSEDIVLLVDDVVPSDKYAALRDQIACQVAKKGNGVNDNFWMGDVYKVVKLLSKYHPELSLCTIVEPGENPQSLILRKGSKVHIDIQDVATLKGDVIDDTFEVVLRSGIPDYFNPMSFEDSLKILSQNLENKRRNK